VPESDVLKAFRERRVGVSKESIYDPVKVRNAMRVIKELLAARRTSERDRRRAHAKKFQQRHWHHFSSTKATAFAWSIQFEGNTVFSDGACAAR
jgi:hypothetical protein